MNRLLSLLGATHGRLVFARRARVLASLLGARVPPASTILDVGCGDGTISHLIAQQQPGLTVRGLEIMARPSCRIPCETFDGRHLPLPDRAVDVCLFVDVLHHAGDPRALLAEAVRVTRRHILIKDHLAETRWDHAVLRFMDWAGNRPHGVVLPYHYLGRAAWHRLFQELGLTVADWSEHVPLYPFPASLVFGRRLHFVGLLSREASPAPAA